MLMINSFHFFLSNHHHTQFVWFLIIYNAGCTYTYKCAIQLLYVKEGTNKKKEEKLTFTTSFDGENVTGSIHK